MKVYAIRHGESETNKSQTWTGWMDVCLTEKGRGDAAKAGDFLKSVSFDAIYSSDLARARETADIAIPGCQYELSALLREINVGSLAGNQVSVITEEQRAEADAKGYKAFGGESKTELGHRVETFMKLLEDKACESVAVFTHAGWLRAMLDEVIGVKIPRNHICCNNCTIAIFEYTGKLWRLHSWINTV